MEHSSKGIIGLLGSATTFGSAVIALLPTVNLIVQICAGITAIIVGVFTARYYHKKHKELGD